MSQTSKTGTESGFFDLSLCSYRDQAYLKGQLKKLSSADPERKKKTLEGLENKYRSACERLEQKLGKEISVRYPEDLPVSQRAEDIKRALSAHQVVIVAGETGSGKTTQLPKMCLELGLGRRGLIGHTQPRRIAARSVSSRIAEELGSSVGDIVGYQVRFTDQTSDDSFIKVMTDGILLSEIKRDRDLRRYEVIIIDEAHERSLNIDFILGYLKQLLPRRPELKVLITSATIDVERFADHFQNAPVIEVSGRSFPVDIVYQDTNSGDENELGLPEQVEQLLHEIVEEERARSWSLGDILVFLPGEREIREVSKHLRHAELRDTEVLPLYARLSNAEQARIFANHSGRRVVLSTNVAETSLTVPGIRYVIDSGLVRMSRYSVRSKIQRLPIERVSQASANQRAGRCGRIAPGICYRLYSEEDFQSRPEFSDPEILRTNLASVILKMKDSGLGEVSRFPFVDMPDKRLWNDGFKLLFELGAVDQRNNLTSLGRKLAYFPVDPRVGRILLAGVEQGCTEEILIIASALSIQDPRERPADKQQAADQAHALFRDSDSDFVSLLNVWNSYEIQRQELSSSQLKRWCQKHFLSPLRMREWRDLHRQLRLLMKQSLNQTLSDATSTPEAQEPVTNYDAIHKALLAGFLSQIGRHEEKREYLACRNRRFQVFPGSALAKRKVKWLMSAEVVETQQVFARINARIEPDWIEPVAEHLVKRSWSEPHWQKKRGQIVAFEKVTLYGLEIVSRRAVNFANIDPAAAREIFIRTGLVEGEYDCRFPEIKANKALLETLEGLEDRTRKRDIVVDENTVYELYDARLPAHIVSAASFEKWFKKLGDPERKQFCFDRQELLRQEAPAFDPASFPDTLDNNGIRFPLSYQFNPGGQDDGVTISVPVHAARQVSANRLEKLVPGLLREKCIQLIKALPRVLRKNFVPVPDVVDRILPEVEANEDPLLEALSFALKRHMGVEVPFHAWNLEAIDSYLRFNIEILNEQGTTIEKGRDLSKLVAKVEHLIDRAPQIRQSKHADPIRSKQWEFGEIEPFVEIKQAGIVVKMFPALQDCGDEVERVLLADAYSAERATRLGLARLLFHRLKPQISAFPKLLNEYKKLGLLYATVGQSAALYDDFAMYVIVSHFLSGSLIRTESELDARYEEKRADFMDFAASQCALVYAVLERYHRLMKQLKGKVSLALAIPMADLQMQLGQLIYDGFLSQSSERHLQHYPRYLEACEVRLEKMPREMGKEREYVPKLKAWWDAYLKRKQACDQQGLYDEALEHFRWMLEEQRVSWYAQQLGTVETVSEKRLNRTWEAIRKS